MIYIITKSQLKTLTEQKSDYLVDRQSNALMRATGARGEENYQAVNQFVQDQAKKIEINPHTLLTILQIGTAFIPYVGFYISSGIGLYDAKLYYDEGDTKTAAIVGVFSLIPGMGALAGKVSGQLSAKQMAQIGSKIMRGEKLTKLEQTVANNFAKYRTQIQAELAKKSNQISTATKVVRGQLTKQGLKKTGATVAGYGAAGMGTGKAYDAAQANTPRLKVEKAGLNWEFVRNTFGSKGTAEDNQLLNQAWDAGWRPGNIVPEKFQTPLYKQELAAEQQVVNDYLSQKSNQK